MLQLKRVVIHRDKNINNKQQFFLKKSQKLTEKLINLFIVLSVDWTVL